jgi:hypothetical protein
LIYYVLTNFSGEIVKFRKSKAVFILLAGMGLAGSLQAQTNHAVMASPAALRVMAVHPAVAATRVVTDAGPDRATVKFTLPQNLTSYHVMEEQGHVARPATNVATTSQNEVEASLAAGSTLMFVEKEPQSAVQPVSPAGSKRLFSTYFVKAMAPAQPGQQPHTASGVLSMFADDPILWNAASNAYVAYLTVVFSTEDPMQNSPLLPMAVALTGQNIQSIDPRHIELEKANMGKDVVVICGQYQKDVQITAHYLTATNTIPLKLQRLTTWSITQMIISKPMLFASLMGGLIGGLLRLFKGSKWGAKRIAHYLAEGVTVGLVTVTLLLAGLLQNQIAELSTQPQLVLAFALAAAAGSVGAHFLDKTVNHLRGK